MVVPDRRHGVALACDGSRGAPVAGHGAGDRLAARVDEAVAAVDPERQLDRRVVEGVGHDRPQVGGVRVAGDATHEPLQGAAGEEARLDDRDMNPYISRVRPMVTDQPMSHSVSGVRSRTPMARP